VGGAPTGAMSGGKPFLFTKVNAWARQSSRGLNHKTDDALAQSEPPSPRITTEHLPAGRKTVKQDRVDLWARESKRDLTVSPALNARYSCYRPSLSG
jgi:hypothetical protein